MRTRTPLLLAGVACVALSGCITGERPTLVDEPATVIEDPSVLSVVDRLDAADSGRWTATYRIIPTLTGQTTEATVEVAGQARRITIGNVEYVTDGESSRTCEDGPDGCVGFIDNARISNLSVTTEFWGDAFAARLRLDASRRVGFTEGSDAEIAGMPAACVSIPLPGTGNVDPSVQYCALDQGPLARYYGADVSIEMTSYRQGAGDIEL